MEALPWPVVAAEPSGGGHIARRAAQLFKMCQRLTLSFLMVQKLWPWGDVCSKMVALMETFM